ncbi:MAG: hypothetical protein P8M17_01645 [Saprospiraceae bacterium]|nr:hypothetical protein [Saprospiraceae bacterium]MDG2417666.1 hypothetical protein [Saprospiraceae bacterium]
MKNNKKEIQDELEELAPLLSKLKKEEGFSFPDDYFNQLPEQILNQIDFSKNKKVKETISAAATITWVDQLIEQLASFFRPKIAMGFSMMVMLGIACISIFNDLNEVDISVVDLTSNDLEDYVKTNIDDFEIQELLNVLGDEEEISWTKIKMNDEDLDGYIDEIIDDIDATELEDFL